MCQVHCRWMIRRDMPEVLEIEGESAWTLWSEEDFLRALRQRNCIGMVAEDKDNRIVGFMVYELRKHHLTLLNLAVAADFRRRGVGRQMVQKLASKLSCQRRSRLRIVVNEGNLGAQLFLRACGFAATKVMPRAFDGDDGYVMILPAVAPVESEGLCCPV